MASDAVKHLPAFNTNLWLVGTMVGYLSQIPRETYLNFWENWMLTGLAEHTFPEKIWRLKLQIDFVGHGESVVYLNELIKCQKLLIV